MADNVTLNTMSGGSVVATDDVGGVQYQRVKQVWGVDGVATDVTAATPLPTSSIATAITSSGPTSVTAAAADTLLLASNAARRGAAFFNDSSATLYISLGTNAASTTAFTCKVAAMGYFELPFGYSGQIRGIWSSATGAVRVTEVTT